MPAQPMLSTPKPTPTATRILIFTPGPHATKCSSDHANINNKDGFIDQLKVIVYVYINLTPDVHVPKHLGQLFLVLFGEGKKEDWKIYWNFILFIWLVDGSKIFRATAKIEG